jgi:exopolysaccharide biosynthesis polyprenyl glycosylphosphotransferase
MILVVASRAVARAAVSRVRPEVQKVVIVGAGQAGQLVAKKILTHTEYGMELVCFVDAEPIALAPELTDIPVLHRPGALWKLIDRVRVDRVILAYSRQPDEERLDLAHSLRAEGLHVDVVPRLFELLGPEAELHYVEAFPLLGLPPLSSPHGSSLKRAFDFGASVVLLVLLLPVFAVVALLVRVGSPGPVLFRSRRIGTGGRPFFAFKFRTMEKEADENLGKLLEHENLLNEYRRAHKFQNDPRITAAGKWIRRLSLDELPQLLNVARGELSLVGPRPITTTEFEEFVDGASKGGAWSDVRGYWDIPGLRPGLTGLWQINGRSSIDYEERVRLDKLYVSNWRFRLDLLIIAKTLRALVSGAGAA